jgi:hypothetical protein
MDEATKGIESVVTTQLARVQQWMNVPGNLSKVSSSAGGFVWGYNSENKLFRCPLPCTGNWKEVELNNVSTIFDVATDASNVYLLVDGSSGQRKLLINPVASTGEFNEVLVFSEATKIFSTHTFIWTQDSSNKKQRCAKPCTTGGWISSTDTHVRITSASETALYGVDSSGTPLKSDETLQTGWTPINELAGRKLTALLGQLDNTALYGVENGGLLREERGDTEPVTTYGQTPSSLSADPFTKDVWMTTEGRGEMGNIFTKIDKPDYSSIMNKIRPLDQRRDQVVQGAEAQYAQQDKITGLNKSLKDFVDFFYAKFGITKDTLKETEDDIGGLQNDIKRTQGTLDLMAGTQPIVEVLFLTLLAVLFLYVFASFIGQLIHTLAFLVLIGGLVYAITYNGGSDPSGNSNGPISAHLRL